MRHPQYGAKPGTPTAHEFGCTCPEHHPGRWTLIWASCWHDTRIWHLAPPRNWNYPRDGQWHHHPTTTSAISDTMTALHACPIHGDAP